jgi:hypothetical protein
MRKCYDREKNDVRILKVLHFFSPPEYKEVVFEMLSLCMCALLVLEQLDGFYLYSVFKSSSIIR